jgi:hypothetical protein
MRLSILPFLLGCVYTVATGDGDLTFRGLCYSEITQMGSHNSPFVGNSLSANQMKSVEA